MTSTRKPKHKATNGNQPAPASAVVMTEAEAAEYMRVSARQLQRWRKIGAGPRFLRLGGSVGGIRYFRRDLDAYLESRRAGGDGQAQAVQA